MNIPDMISRANLAFTLDSFGHPTGMTDAQYDELLKTIQTVHPDWKPTCAGNSDSIRHLYAYQSPIFKNTNLQQFKEFSGLITAKGDGCSISAYYHSGRLTHVVSRSNELTGFLKPNLAKHFPEIVPSTRIVRIDGELLVPCRLTPRPRQAANGIVNSNDNQGTFHVMHFDVVMSSDSRDFDYAERFNLAGLKPPLLTESEAEEAIKTRKFKIVGEEYPMDGLVKYAGDSFAIYKMPYGDSNTTTILRFDWKHSSHFNWVPTAVFEPIHLNGSRIQRAATNINKLDSGIGPGAGVKVGLAKQVIPQITELVSPRTDGNSPILKYCPRCNGVLQRDRTKLYCVNPDCPSTPDMRGWTCDRLRDFLKTRISFVKNLHRLSSEMGKGEWFGGSYQTDLVYRFHHAWCLQNGEIARVVLHVDSDSHDSEKIPDQPKTDS